MIDLKSLFPSGFAGVRLDPFRAFAPDLWSESYFRANELANLYVDFEVDCLLTHQRGFGRISRISHKRQSQFDWLFAKAKRSVFADPGRGGSHLARALAGAETELREAILAEESALEPVLALVALAADGYPEYLSGERSGAEILFAKGTASLWEKYFDNQNPIYRPFNRLAAGAARGVVAGRAAAGGLRVLEVGAGCGSGSEALLAALAAPIDLYLLTDISPNFLRKARERALAAASGKQVRLECRLLDLNKPPAGWGLPAESFDLVYAVNVLHALSDLEASLRGLHALLRPGAPLVLGECIRPRRGFPLHQEFVFQLLYEPGERRVQPEYRPAWGFLEAAGWREALARGGFVEVAFLPDFEAAVAAYPEHSVAAVVARKPAGGPREAGAAR